MNLGQLLSELQLPHEADALFAPHWRESDGVFPPGGPEWLRDNDVVSLQEFAGLGSCWTAPLLAAARAVRAHPTLSRLAWHVSRLAFEHLDYDIEQARQWPDLIQLLGDQAPLFWLLVGLQALPRMRSAHRRRGIPENVSRDTCSYFHEFTGLFALTNEGRLGMLPNMLPWLRHHASGELCCLGRLEYMVKPFQGRVRAFRHRPSGLVLAFADTGATFDANGLGAVPSSLESPEDPWNAVLSESEHDITGHPIAPDGRALRQKIRLERRDWEPALVPGDSVLEVHIPPGAGMTPDRCADSMRRALDFFPRYFPETRFEGFACYSWILNPELAEFYSPTSNMVLWQRELYLFPVPSNGRGGIGFVFGREDVDPDTAPRDTSLRRALLSRLAEGLPLREGGMFCLVKEYEQFGAQPYRQRWHEIEALVGL